MMIHELIVHMPRVRKYPFLLHKFMSLRYRSFIYVLDQKVVYENITFKVRSVFFTQWTAFQSAQFLSNARDPTALRVALITSQTRTELANNEELKLAFLQI